MWRRAASGNNSYCLILTPLPQSVDNKEHRAYAERSQSYPAFLLASRFVALGQCIGIVECERGDFKADIVFEKVTAVFSLVPFKAHYFAWHQT